jgi:hypothetical protein
VLLHAVADWRGIFDGDKANIFVDKHGDERVSIRMFREEGQELAEWFFDDDAKDSWAMTTEGHLDPPVMKKWRTRCHYPNRAGTNSLPIWRFAKY